MILLFDIVPIRSGNEAGRPELDLAMDSLEDLCVQWCSG